MRPLDQLVLRRPKTVIVLWIVLLATAAPLALQLGGALRGSTDAVTGSPSELVSRDLNAAFGEGSAFVFPAVLTSASTPITDPAFAAAAATLMGLMGRANWWLPGRRRARRGLRLRVTRWRWRWRRRRRVFVDRPGRRRGGGQPGGLDLVSIGPPRCQ